MNWFRRNVACVGSVLFRGSMPPRSEDFSFLESLGVRMTGRTEPQHHWSVNLEHEQWGSAWLVCLRDVPPPSRELVAYDARLTEDQKELAMLGESTVAVRMEGRRGNILRDRKLLLRYLRAVMGDDGLMALDHTASLFWPRGALDDELAHDADLDIQAIYSCHAVLSDDNEGVSWLHSHGLGEIGFFDFDVLEPSDDLLGAASDALRAIAFGIVEGAATISTPRFKVIQPDGDVAFVEASEFDRKADRRYAALREMDDPEHNQRRAVLCEPMDGLLSRWFGKIQPSKLLSAPLGEEKLITFSTAASNLMGERARQTYPCLRELADELAEFAFPVIAKLGIRIDGGDPDDKEHVWFEVKELKEDSFDGELVSSPLNIAGMKAGDRCRHSLELLSDWAILTPVGMINPRDTTPMHLIRARRDELRQLMNEDKDQIPSSKATGDES